MSRSRTFWSQGSAEIIQEFPRIIRGLPRIIMKGGQVEIQWIKGNADAVYIETDKGAGTWSFLAVDTVPHYTDATPTTTIGHWKYRAIYLVTDEKVGHGVTLLV